MASFYQVLLNGIPQEFDGDAVWTKPEQAVAAAEEICASRLGSRIEHDRIVNSRIYLCEVEDGKLTGRDNTEDVCQFVAKARIRTHLKGESITPDTDQEYVFGGFVTHHASDLCDALFNEAVTEARAA